MAKTKFSVFANSDLELEQRMAFYNNLMTMRYEQGKNIGNEHTPVNGNAGFRFGYPFNNVRFDSVKGWQSLRQGFGWQNTNDNSSRIIRCRFHFGLGKAEGNDEAYERVMDDINRGNRRKQEITDAYNDIKNLRPVPATIANITAILRYYKMQGFVGDLLPMDIGYSCNDYDCDGKYAVAIKLERPITYNEDGEQSDRFVCGAPRGHLTKYTRI